MKTIEIEDTIYEHLLKKATRFGETASEILQRELSIPNGERGPRRQSFRKGKESAVSDDQKDLSECLNSAQFRSTNLVVKRFLLILSHLHKRHPERFSELLAISGRSRKYFSRDRDELMKSGRSVNPKLIPGTPYWAVTNNDTDHKAEIVGKLLDRFGYSDSAVKQSRASLYEVSTAQPSKNDDEVEDFI